MHAASPDRIHTITIDYRGFGNSSGTPSEKGLLQDALAVADWAMREAKIPLPRIVLFGQSLGTAVCISLAHHLALRAEPVLFSSMVLVAPFFDVESLTATYRVGGVVPILGPLARLPWLMTFFTSFICAKWASGDKLADFVRICESMSARERKYDVTVIHAEDDFDIPWEHSERLFQHATKAAGSARNLEAVAGKFDAKFGSAGGLVCHETARVVLRKQITKWGLHDRIMSHPIVSLAVLRAFQLDSES
ncbi:Alpha/Beta hydrolase protein [Podospora aff. communis PSN243]|uniref:Alpha/Beta hydrolase protein n=1 Tax=Podospora aff. communis PSN243 TaxID=3040156 RepID=A0AAV9GWF0_9PEZI|nr:Alpha/Beta hydrolase protein [Podospora aff. communis PSN243]